MLYYIFVCLCFVQSSSAAAYPKYISSPAHNNRLQMEFDQTDSISELEVTLPSQLLKSFLPSSDIKAPKDIKIEEKQANPVPPKEHMGLEELVEEIRSYRFKEAELILREMNFSKRIPEIVHNVYNHSKSNIDLLIGFGRDFTKTDLACSILFVLLDEMKANGHSDVHKLITLVNAIESKLKTLKGSPEWKAQDESVTNKTILDISTASVEVLKEAMITDNNQVRLLADSILKLDSKHQVSTDEVIQKVSNESFSQISAIKVAQSLYSQVTFLSQAISGLQELFNKLENANNLNNPAVLNIAEYIKRIINTPSYVNLGKSKKEAVDMMIKKMPICARNLLLEPFVCIWNKAKSEYLYVAGSEFNRNEDKRSVFTRTTRKPVGPGVWIVEKSGDEFFFRNKAYEKEYLFAASGIHDKDRRFVHTWAEGGKVGNKSSWKIELEGDSCYLRNVNFDEYLFASDRQSGDKSRYTFTWIPKTFTKEDNFKWQIRSCDMSEILKKGV